MEYLTQSHYPWEKDAEWGREVGGNSCWRETHIITTSARSWTHFSCDTTQIQGIMPWCTKWCKVNVKQHLSVFGPLFAQRCVLHSLHPCEWLCRRGASPVLLHWSLWCGRGERALCLLSVKSFPAWSYLNFHLPANLPPSASLHRGDNVQSVYEMGLWRPKTNCPQGPAQWQPFSARRQPHEDTISLERQLVVNELLTFSTYCIGI